MSNLTFVIYGAGSDIVAPVFDDFSGSDFICLVNKTKPSYLKGRVIQTGDDSYKQELQTALSEVEKSRMIVFINAAVFQKDELFIGHSKVDIEKMIDVGITKSLLITQSVLSEMLKKRRGRIINLSSFRSLAPAKGAAIYAAIKSFSNTFFSAIGIEYGRFDITSNSIAIGFADSKLLDRLESQKLKEFKKNVSKNKFLPSNEFISTLKFIIESEYLNSAVIDLNGGLSFLE